MMSDSSIGTAQKINRNKAQTGGPVQPHARDVRNRIVAGLDLLTPEHVIGASCGCSQLVSTTASTASCRCRPSLDAQCRAMSPLQNHRQRNMAVVVITNVSVTNTGEHCGVTVFSNFRHGGQTLGPAGRSSKPRRWRYDRGGRQQTMRKRGSMLVPARSTGNDPSARVRPKIEAKPGGRKKWHGELRQAASVRVHQPSAVPGLRV